MQDCIPRSAYVPEWRIQVKYKISRHTHSPVTRWVRHVCVDQFPIQNGEWSECNEVQTYKGFSGIQGSKLIKVSVVNRVPNGEPKSKHHGFHLDTSVVNLCWPGNAIPHRYGDAKVENTKIRKSVKHVKEMEWDA